MKNLLKNTVRTIFFFTSIFGMVFLLAGQDFHQASPPVSVGEELQPFSEEGVHVSARAYTPQESKTFLSRDLKKRGYQPIQVTIQNNTENTYLLTQNGLDLQVASSEKVSNSVANRSLPRSIAYKVAGFFFWPVLIPGTIDGIITYRSHVKMRADYYAKSLKEEPEEILPYSTIHRVIFVPVKRVENSFTLYLMEKKSSQYHSFSVQIS